MNATKFLRMPRRLLYTQARQYVNVGSDESGSERTTTAAVQPMPKSNHERLKMCGWQIHSYGGLEELHLSETMKMPQIRNAQDCLIRVRATTVNPIDVAMVGGYGATALKALRCRPGEIEFPLTLGREFCGEIVQKGMAISDEKFEVGERVFGVVPVHAAGAHAEFVSVPASCLSKPPEWLSTEDAASVLYAGLTAWSGIYVSAGLGGVCGAFSPSGGGALKRVLVLGGSGSVGSAAIQILRSQGAQVLATCSADAVELVRGHGAHHVFDYKIDQEMQDLSNYAPYDVVLDCAGQGADYADSLSFDYRQYVTFSSPLLRNTDSSGLTVGMLQNITALLKSNAKTLCQKGAVVKYGFFLPAPHGIEFLQTLVASKKLLPIVDSCYTFMEMPQAFNHVQSGHLRGKIVVKL